MQLFALDSQGQPIAAAHASKQEDYRCLECNGIVRRRSGPHRQPHYFHLRESPSCFLSGKSMAHLQIQCRLWHLLPCGECHLEQRFPSIGRIADVAWLPKRLIFEVQCSPIDGEEIAARNRDYASIGFQVVWILHDRHYNQRRVREAEEALKERPHYFSNIDSQGIGDIYDQFDVMKGGRRIVKLPPLQVDLSEPKMVRENSLRPQWPLHFAGDLLEAPEEYLANVRELRERFSSSFYKGVLAWWTWPYQIVMQTLLERACK